jgi:D-cysteine desulfhydrase
MKALNDLRALVDHWQALAQRGLDTAELIELGDESMAADLAAEMDKEAHAVAAAGGQAYVIPGGGSNPLGALGYAACAAEIIAQSFEMGLPFDRIVVASGSAGTHAGILSGLAAINARVPVIGINVRRERREQEGNVHRLAMATSALLDTPAPQRADVVALDNWVGPGYSLPTPQMVAAVKMLAQTEGILLDPVYTGKAMAGLIALVRGGTFEPTERVLFVHTGGSPSLHAYARDLRDPALNGAIGRQSAFLAAWGRRRRQISSPA